jgi:hypothetical protein
MKNWMDTDNKYIEIKLGNLELDIGRDIDSGTGKVSDRSLDVDNDGRDMNLGICDGGNGG